MEPELLEPRFREKSPIEILSFIAILFAVVTLTIILFTAVAHADEPTTYEVVACIETDNECLESIGYFDNTVTEESWIAAYEGYEVQAEELLINNPDKSFEELDVMMLDLIENYGN